MHQRHALAIAGSALAGLFIAGCGVFAPDDSASAADSPAEPAPTAESEDHTTGLEHISEGAGPAPDNDRPVDMGISEDRAPAEVEDGVIIPDDVDMSTVYSDTPLTQREVDVLSREFELHAVCTDEAALAANAGHEPAGWPAEREPGDPLPNPECHPDFIEVHEWEHYDTFYACCEGPQTSIAVTDRNATEQSEFKRLWGQSQSRANWSPENDDRVTDW